jgi:hypothetical protein
MNKWIIPRRIDLGSRDHSGWLPVGAAIPPRTSANDADVWIEENPDGFFLFAGDAQVATDTWHKTLEDAVSQAEFQFGIAQNEWRRETDT